MNLLSGIALFLLAIPFAAQAQKRDKPPLNPIPADVTFAPANPALPTIFIVGDSTAREWGPHVAALFDPAKVNLVPAGASGRSSRTYINEGIWARVLKQVRPHDIVLVQFGHNDPFSLVDSNRSRGSIKGIGDETKEVDNPLLHQHEVVRTFGAYLRQYIHDIQAKGAVPIVMSRTPHNDWKDGHLQPDTIGYSAWASAVAQKEHVDFVDVNGIIAAHFEPLGETKTAAFFKPNDKVHVTPAGWDLYAAWIVSGLKALPDAPVSRFLSGQDKVIPPAPGK